MKKIKLAIFIGNLTIGGAERIVAHLINYLLNNITKYLIVLENKIDYKIECNIINLNVKISKNFIINIFKFFQIQRKLFHIKRKYNFTHCISFLEGANIINLLTKHKEKVFISVRSYKFSKDKSGRINGKIFRQIIKLLYNKADKIITVSKVIKEELHKNYNIDENKIYIIYNLFDIDHIHEESQEPLCEYENIFHSPVIVNAGRLAEPKGQWYLIRIFHLIKLKIPDVKLLILGDGNLKGYLIEMAENYKLKVYYNDNKQHIDENYDIYLLGTQQNPYKFISNSSLFVLTSLWEGFPNVLIEAIVCGTPVISADCKSGPREILSPESGFIDHLEDAEYARYGILMPNFSGLYYKYEDPMTKAEILWAETIIKLINDDEVRNKYKSIGTLRATDFSIEKIIREWEHILYFD